MPTVYWTGGDWLERWAWQLAPRYMGNLAGTSVPENLNIEGTVPPPTSPGGWRDVPTRPWNPRDVEPRRPETENEEQQTNNIPFSILGIVALVLLLK